MESYLGGEAVPDTYKREKEKNIGFYNVLGECNTKESEI